MSYKSYQSQQQQQDKSIFGNLMTSSKILTGLITNYDIEKYQIMKNDEIINSLRRYYGSGHYKINDVFRVPNSEIDHDTKFDIMNIDRAMEKIKPFRLTDNFVVWRGIDLNERDIFHKKTYYDKMMKLKQTKYINEPSYLSTSYDFETAIGFSDCCLYKITVPVSEDLNYISIELKGEKEILFQHSTHLEYINDYIISVEMSGGRGYRNVKVFEVILRNGLKPELQEERKEIKQDYNSILNRFKDSYTKDTIEDLITLNNSPEDIFNEFIEQLRNTNTDIEFVNKIKNRLRKDIYEYIEEIINE
jgi:hypothetical protein